MRPQLIASSIAHSIDSYDTTILTPARKLYLNADRTIWCIVDADFYDEWISQKTWNWGRSSNSRTPIARRFLYAKRNVGAARMTIWLHRAIMMKARPLPEWMAAAKVVDHKNGQTLDNRRINLRWATRGENAKNRVQFPPKLAWIWENLCTDASAELEGMPF